MKGNPNMLIVAFLVPLLYNRSDILNFRIVKALFSGVVDLQFPVIVSL